jgi:RHS repeat-associated protein
VWFNIRASFARVFTLFRFFAITLVFLSYAAAASASQTIYFNDFQGTIGGEWSTTAASGLHIASAPNPDYGGTRLFLGEYGNDTVTLSLNGLPTHGQVTVSFSLYLIRDWNGNNTLVVNGDALGPDVWSLSVADGPVLINTTFSNGDPAGQAYSPSPSATSCNPGYNAVYPPGTYNPMTGATECYSLGYMYDIPPLGSEQMDSVYELSFTFPHTADSLTLDFAALGLQGIADESWGLDNVRVEVSTEAAAQSFQWPFAPFTTTPIVTQDYACRGTANLINGTVDDVCFSQTHYHSAIDIKPAGSDGTVYAAGAGTVVLAHSSCAAGDAACNNGFGNWVIIEHGNNIYSLYSQLQQNSLTVAPGSVVTQGQAIATMGATGNVTGPHLNFAMGGLEAAPFLDAFQAGHPGAYGYYDPWTYISTASFAPTPVRVVNAADLNVRRGPGTNYSVFTEVGYNQVFVAFAKVGDWYRIHLPCGSNSCAGWISAQSIHSVIDPSVAQVQVTGTGTAPMNVRSTPNSGSAALDMIYLSQKFVVSGNSQTISGSGCTQPWYPIYLPSMTSDAASGWVCGDSLLIETGAATTGNGTSSWVHTNGPNGPGPSGSYVFALAIDPIDPNIVYTGTGSAGVYKSIDGGTNWNAANAGLGNTGVNTIAIDPTEPNIVYAGTRIGGIYKSIDGGTSWNAINSGLAYLFVSSLVVDPSDSNIVYASAYNDFGGWSVYKTTNSGASWNAINTGLSSAVGPLAIDPANPNILYAGTGVGTMYKTINGGVSWNVVNTGFNIRYLYSLAIDPINPSTVYAGYYLSGIYKTTNGGMSWNAVNAGLSDTGVWALAIDPITPNTVYAGIYPGRVYKTSNGGTNWSAINTGLDSISFLYDLVIDPTNPRILYVGTNNGVYKYGVSYSYSLQGQVTKDSTALSGVILSVPGSGAGSVVSGASGYNFSDLAAGSYAITPSLNSHIFDPPSRSITISGFDLTGLDFRACDTSTPLTGTLRDATTNAPISGVNVIVDGVPRAPPTDANGNYSIAGLGCGTHTVSIDTPTGYQSYGSRSFDSYNSWNFNIQLTTNSTTQGLQTLAGYAADPVNTATGNYVYQRSDLALPGKGLPFVFERSYNSQAASDPAAVDGPLGYGWTHSYNASLAVDGSGNVTIHWGDGKTETFASAGGGAFTPQYGVFDTLTALGGGAFELRKKELTTYSFDSIGKLTSITDKNDNTLTLTYTGGNFTRITDTAGRHIDFTYDAGNHITQITDPLGRTAQFAYDDNGNLISAIDRRGNATTYTYDGNHQVLTVIDPRGNVIVSNTYDAAKRVVTYQTDAKGGATSYNYSELDRVTTITDALGNITVHYHDELLRLIKEVSPRGFATEYVYDTAGNRVQVTDKNGNVTKYEYDPKGNVTGKTDALGKATTITYDGNNNPLTRTDALGNVTNFTYDPNGNLTRTTDALGNQVNITYDTSGLPLTVADARGNVTTNTYDAQGNLIQVAAPLGNATTYTYDATGRRLTRTDALGRVTQYGYDPNDNLLTLTDAQGQVMSHGYDANNNRITETDRRGFSTQYTYDSKDLLETATDALSGVVTNGYDALDRRISMIDKRGNATNFAYDEAGNLIRTTDALGNVTRYIYDANGNRTAVIDPLNHTSSFTYDVLNRRVTASDALSNTATTAYDELGRVAFTTNAKGQSTNFTYDAIGRLIRVTDANGGIVQYGYDPNGNRISMTDPNGNTTSYIYDALNRLITKTEALGNVTNYQYDLVGNLTQVTKPNGTVIQYAYDALNRLTTVTYPDSSTVNFVYDENGNRVQMTDSAGTTSDQYDALNRVTRHDDPFGNVVNYGYDANGNRTSLTYPGNKTVTYAYDALNRMASVTNWLTNITTYSYDAAGRLVQAANPNGTSATYAYDNANRLTSLANNHGGTVISSYAYTLDPIGNHTQETRDELLLPVITPGMVAYTYDAENRLTNAGGVANSFDLNGNMTAKGADIFAYDFEDRLKNSTINSTLSQYQYDGTGNRLAKTTDAMTTRYVLDLNGSLSKVLAETDATNAVSSYYVYGLGLISRIAPDGSTHYYHYDSRGSIIALTDATGTITDKYAYDPFGKLANSQGTTLNPFKYVGRYGVIDEGNGLQYIRARYYDPGAGRFISKDAKAGKDNDGQSLNKYVYALNNPVMLIDISGYSPSEVNGNRPRDMLLTSDVSHTFTLENTASYFEGLAYRSLEAAASELGGDIFTEGFSRLLTTEYARLGRGLDVTNYSAAMQTVQGGLLVLDFALEANKELNRIGASWSDAAEAVDNMGETFKFAMENPDAVARGFDSAGAIILNVATKGILDVSGEQLRAGVTRGQELYMGGINLAGEKLYDAATATKQRFKDMFGQ